LGYALYKFTFYLLTYYLLRLLKSRKSSLFICQIKPESNEQSVLTSKLFQMLTTRSVKNEERAVQLESVECCLYSLYG